MSRWIAALPETGVVYFAACEVVYRGLVALGTPVQPVGDHFGILAGYAFKSSDYVPEGVRLLRNINVKPDRIDWSKAACISTEDAREYEHFQLAAGDLVMSMDGTVNNQGIKIAFVGESDVPALLLQRVCRFDELGSVDKRFLYHILHSEDFLDHLDESNRSIAIPHVSPGQLKSFKIPIPDRRTQVVICDFLDAVKGRVPASQWPTLPSVLAQQRRIVARIEELAGQINQARELRQQAAEESEALVRSARNNIFAKLQKKFEDVRLGDICFKITDGPHVSPRYVDDGIPFISVRNISETGLDFSSAKYVSERDHMEFSKKAAVERGDVLYTKGGTTGIARRVETDRPFSIWVHVALLKLCRARAESGFVEHMLNSPSCKEQSEFFTRGSSNRDLGLNRMAKILFPLPPISEQRKVISYLDGLQEKVRSLKATHSSRAFFLLD